MKKTISVISVIVGVIIALWFFLQFFLSKTTDQAQPPLDLLPSLSTFPKTVDDMKTPTTSLWCSYHDCKG